MRKEAERVSASTEQLQGNVEEWKHKWQDPTFTRAFPTLVQRYILEEKNSPEDQKKLIFESSLLSFLELPWKGGEKGAIAANGLLRRENGEAEPLLRAEIASLLLLGLSLSDREYVKNLVVANYHLLTYNRKASFRQHVFRLITNNNVSRKQIKDNQLDFKSGFNWDKEVTELALRLRYESEKSKPIEELPLYLPVEFTSELDKFAPYAIIEFLNYAVDYVNRLPVRSLKRKDLTEFIVEVEGLDSSFFGDQKLFSTVQEKLSQLKTIIPTISTSKKTS